MNLDAWIGSVTGTLKALVAQDYDKARDALVAVDAALDGEAAADEPITLAVSDRDETPAGTSPDWLQGA